MIVQKYVLLHTILLILFTTAYVHFTSRIYRWYSVYSCIRTFRIYRWYSVWGVIL